MCEILKTFFCSVFTDEDINKLPEPKCIFLDDDSNKLCNFVITKDKVYNKLGQLKENKAPGPDRLSPKLLQEIKMEISEPLCSIFNPLDAGRWYTGFSQTSKRRQTPVYRVCANLPTLPETGILGLHKLSNGANHQHTGFIF